MKLRPNAGFLPALVAGGREQKRKGGPIHMGSENRPCLGSPAFPPATKAERDTFDLRLAWLPMLASAGRPEGEAGEGGDDGASHPESGPSSSASPTDDEGVQPT